ncbi:MAG: NAD(P)/FAD-dependent oxidoreductase [Chloroflexota bacterium]
MSDQRFDVAIIGGGLAGCSAAIHLAQRGHSVALFEAQKYPHHKVCGEFLSPECGALLADLGLSAGLQALKPALIHTANIIAPNGTTWTNALPGAGIGISRYALDNLMAEQARACGVNLMTSTSVTDVQGDLDHGFSLAIRNAIGQQTINARTVIGAQGKRSSIDRKLNRGFFQNPQPFMGLKAHFRGSLPAGQIYLYTFAGGYCGMSEIENGLINVCLLVRQDVFQLASQPYPANVDSFIVWMKQQNPALGKWLSGAEQVSESWLSISQVPFVSKQVVVNDILMAGDSAGLIAPVAGDGMGMALQTGRMASDVLDRYLTDQISAAEMCKQYRRLWWRTFGLRLRLSRVLQVFMLRPNWLTPGLRMMNSVPALGRLLVTHTRDNQLVRP